MSNLISDILDENQNISTIYNKFKEQYGYLVPCFLVKKTQVQMMYDRGYVDHYDTPRKIVNFENQLKDFINKDLRQEMLKVIEFSEVYSSDDKVYSKMSTKYLDEDLEMEIEVYYNVPKNCDNKNIIKNKKKLTLKYNDIRSKVQQICEDENRDNKKCIFINMVEVAPPTKNPFTDLENLINLEIFDTSLKINPTHHFLTPKYRLIKNKEEKQDLLDFLSRMDEPIYENDLKAMTFDDPIAKYYNAKPGQIFEIETVNPVAGGVTEKEKYYRKVIDTKLIYT